MMSVVRILPGILRIDEKYSEQLMMPPSLKTPTHLIGLCSKKKRRGCIWKDNLWKRYFEKNQKKK